jgi:hypothetical protein
MFNLVAVPRAASRRSLFRQAMGSAMPPFMPYPPLPQENGQEIAHEPCQ